MTDLGQARAGPGPPLWTAVFNSKGDGSVIGLPREHGADCHHRNAAGRRPVELARTIGNYPVADFFNDLS